MLDVKIEAIHNEPTMKSIQIVEIQPGSIIEEGKIVNVLEVERVLAEAKVNDEFLKMLPLIKDVYQSQLNINKKSLDS